ncbi:MAG: hypothetical protein JW976_00125 [Syntrophaceae bacterium]|nr:hypothetical protein [Syntrophaceae bacterium]
MLVEEYQNPRAKTVLWDGCDDAGILVSFGIYSYQLEAGGFRQGRKMILIKERRKVLYFKIILLLKSSIFNLEILFSGKMLPSGWIIIASESMGVICLTIPQTESWKN